MFDKASHFLLFFSSTGGAYSTAPQTRSLPLEPTARIVRCPTCKKATKLTPANPFRPFCSERCRTTDLGCWADESYKIPVKPGESDWENLEELLEKQENDENPDQ